MSEENNNQTYEETAGEETYEQNGVEINFGRSGGNRVHINIGRAKSKVIRKLSALLPLVCMIAFFVLGFCFNLWHPGWAVFLIIPVGEIILNMFTKKGKALVMSLTVVVCFIAFMVLGLVWNLWHPGWLVFLLLPIVGVIAD